jgi:hypothetical protein
MAARQGCDLGHQLDVEQPKQIGEAGSEREIEHGPARQPGVTFLAGRRRETGFSSSSMLSPCKQGAPNEER